MSKKKLPADLKLKQFDVFKKYNKLRDPSDIESNTPPPLNLENISYANQPLVESILTFIRKSPEVSWDWKYQIIMDKKELSETDMRKIIQYFVGEAVITDSKLDIPIGFLELKDKLKFLEIPSSWLKLIPRRTERIKKGK